MGGLKIDTGQIRRRILMLLSRTAPVRSPGRAPLFYWIAFINIVRPTHPPNPSHSPHLGPTRRPSAPATPKQTLTPLSFATSGPETENSPTPSEADEDFFRSATMLGLYIGTGIFLLTTLAICIFLRRTMAEPLALEVEEPLVDDPSLPTEGTIQI
jgi:hypothetical protein